jgi:hypothetical protein
VKPERNQDVTFNNPGRAARNRRPGTHKRRSHKMKDIIHHFYADGDATDLTLCLVGLGVVAAILIAIGIGSGAY